MTVYSKSMMEALAEVRGLQEDNMDLMRKAAGGAMQTIKMKDGKLQMDSFTASAIMKVYDKVNPANQKKMAKMINDGKKSGIMKLQDFAMKQVKSEYEPQDEQLAKMKGNTPADKGRRAATQDDIDRAEKKGDKKLVKKLKEASWKMPKNKRQILPLLKLMRKPIKLGKDGDAAAKVVEPYIGDDELLDDIYDAGEKNPKGDARPFIRDALQRFGLPWDLDENELDEARKDNYYTVGGDRYDGGVVFTVYVKGKKVHSQILDGAQDYEFKGKKYKDVNKAMDAIAKAHRLKSSDFKKVNEEVGLDEGKMSQIDQMMKDGKSAKEIAKALKMDVKAVKKVMGEAWELGTDEYREYLEKLTPGEKREVEEASARADAMKAMRRGKKVDPADVDTSASDDDIKAASKHIIMQMRKVISLKGDFKVEFGDKKKVKIPVKIAQTVIQKYNKLKKPADKEKFQNQVAKSHRDMLTVLKAGYMAAAYESTDTILGRIDKKIKEIREGTKNV